MIKNSGKLRNFIDVYLPSTDKSNRGQRTGSATKVMENVPASFQDLSGNEMVIAHQLFAAATCRFEFYGSIGTTITAKHTITDTGSGRQFAIGYVKTMDLTGNYYSVLCSEVF